MNAYKNVEGTLDINACTGDSVKIFEGEFSRPRQLSVSEDHMRMFCTDIEMLMLVESSDFEVYRLKPFELWPKKFLASPTACRSLLYEYAFVSGKDLFLGRREFFSNGDETQS